MGTRQKDERWLLTLDPWRAYPYIFAIQKHFPLKSLFFNVENFHSPLPKKKKKLSLFRCCRLPNHFVVKTDKIFIINKVIIRLHHEDTLIEINVSNCLYYFLSTLFFEHHDRILRIIIKGRTHCQREEIIGWIAFTIK